MRWECRAFVRQFGGHSASGRSCGAAAQAAEPADFAMQWTVTLGVEAGVLPTYEGSDRYMLRPFPLFDVRKAGTPPTLPRPARRLRLRPSMTMAASASARRRRSAFRAAKSDDADLRGLGNVDWAIEVGGFADYWLTPWLRTRAELRQGFGGHHGIVSDLTADVVVPADAAS